MEKVKKAGRPTVTPAEVLQKAEVLREHLEQPADPTRPHLGTTYELVKSPLSQQLLTPARLGAWWRRERVQLTDEEIEVCWRWLLPQ